MNPENIDGNNIFKNFAISFFILIIITLIGVFVLHIGFSPSSIAFVYILAVLFTTKYTDGFLYGIFQSVCSMLCYNYFFTEPNFSFQVDNIDYIFIFIIMTITALITSTLTYSVKCNAIVAQKKKEEFKILYNLTNLLADADDIDAISEIAVKNISEYLKCGIGCLLFDENGEPGKTYLFQSYNSQKEVELTNIEFANNLVIKLKNSQYLFENKKYYFPLRGDKNIQGFIIVKGDSIENTLKVDYELFFSIIKCLEMALDRMMSNKQKLKGKEILANERYKTNILRSISHDIRTPLTGIMGISEMLIDMTEKNDTRIDLLNDIYKDAKWLYSLVENILNLTRIQDGKLIINKEPQVADEVIEMAIRHIEKVASNVDIKVELPKELILVPMDIKLIEQVLVNLLDNARKHIDNDGEIVIKLEKKDKKSVVFSVSDNGSGIEDKDFHKIFDTFYTSKNKNTNANIGIGLGLSICSTIIQAHGGRIWAENIKDETSGKTKGAKFSFVLNTV